MSDLKKRLAETMKTALKSGQKDTLAYARNVHAAVRKKEIDEKIELTDDQFQTLIGSLAKQRRESIEQFQSGGRMDLVANEQAELKFLESFLPTQMGEEELKKLIEDAVRDTKASGAKDMGKVMGVLMPKIKGRADGKLVNQLVRSKLG